MQGRKIMSMRRLEAPKQCAFCDSSISLSQLTTAETASEVKRSERKSVVTSFFALHRRSRQNAAGDASEPRVKRTRPVGKIGWIESLRQGKSEKLFPGKFLSQIRNAIFFHFPNYGMKALGAFCEPRRLLSGTNLAATFSTHT